MTPRIGSRQVSLLLSYAALIAYAALNLYPFLWMASGAVKSNQEMLGSMALLPRDWHIQSLMDTWNKLQFFRYFGNSLLYTGASVFGILLIYPLAAFAFAKLDFRGRDLLFGAFVSVMLIPGITGLIPLVILEQKLRLINTWPGLILPTINGAAPLSLFLLRNYFRALPHDMFEAARIDGASTLVIYGRIYLPLSIPALTTVAILNIIAIWNAYIVPSLLITRPQMFTLPLGLSALKMAAVPQWNHLMAGSFIVVLPLLLIFTLLQRYYIAGLTTGATKG